MTSRARSALASLSCALVATLGSVPVARADGALVTHPIGDGGAPLGYVEYLPPGYDGSPGRDYPIVFVLHGAGEQGPGTAPYEPVTLHSPMRDIRDALDRGAVPAFAAREAIMLAPQSPGWWEVTNIRAFVLHALGRYRVDTDRVYMTGLSMGGGGTWLYAAQYADELAAIMPVCGAEVGSPALAMRLDMIPVRAFHGYDDSIVPRSNSESWLNGIAAVRGAAPGISVMTGYPAVGAGPAATHQTAFFELASGTFRWDATPSAPGSERLSYTLYRAGNHFIWPTVYQDETSWDWLFAQSRSGAAATDAGVAFPDAGPPPDAARETPDADVRFDDGGQPVARDDAGSVDAGVTAGADAGRSSRAVGTCACASVGASKAAGGGRAGLVFGLALLALLATRRARR